MCPSDICLADIFLGAIWPDRQLFGHDKYLGRHLYGYTIIGVLHSARGLGKKGQKALVKWVPGYVKP